MRKIVVRIIVEKREMEELQEYVQHLEEYQPSRKKYFVVDGYGNPYVCEDD